MEAAMKWSIRIGTFAGIGVFMHLTFPLIIGWVGLSYWLQTRTLGGVFEGILFTLILFGFVVMHEFGHALTARRYGIKTRDITLYPIGGVARLERMPDKPIQEFWVALAGPAVNVAIAAVLFAWLTVSGSFAPLASLTLTSGPFIERLMLVNISLILFNLIPAFPMDGGRVLRSLLALWLEYPRATRIAATIGQGMALILGLVGLFNNPFLLFIAFFVWVGASQEAAMVQMKAALNGIPVGRVMRTHFLTLSPRDLLSRVVVLILKGSQSDFPVVESGSVVGVVRRADLMAAVARQGQDIPVGQIMRREFQTADSNELLEEAILRMQTSADQSIPVLSQGQLVGMLTYDGISEFLQLRSAIGKSRVEEPEVRTLGSNSRSEAAQ
jgi:Zn-dependent protease/predicted transcriptional regulator